MRGQSSDSPFPLLCKRHRSQLKVTKVSPFCHPNHASRPYDFRARGSSFSANLQRGTLASTRIAATFQNGNHSIASPVWLYLENRIRLWNGALLASCRLLSPCAVPPTHDEAGSPRGYLGSTLSITELLRTDEGGFKRDRRLYRVGKSNQVMPPSKRILRHQLKEPWDDVLALHG